MCYRYTIVAKPPCNEPPFVNSRILDCCVLTDTRWAVGRYPDSLECACLSGSVRSRIRRLHSSMGASPMRYRTELLLEPFTTFWSTTRFHLLWSQCVYIPCESIITTQTIRIHLFSIINLSHRRLHRCLHRRTISSCYTIVALCHHLIYIACHHCLGVFVCCLVARSHHIIPSLHKRQLYHRGTISSSSTAGAEVQPLIWAGARARWKSIWWHM